MDFKPYWLDLDKVAREAFAKRCETSVGHLNNVAYGVKTCSAELAVLIDRESGGVVPCESSNSDVDWAYLRGSTAAPSRVARRKRA